MMRVTPKIRDNPAPTRNRLDAAARPLSAWNRTASRLMRCSCRLGRGLHATQHPEARTTRCWVSQSARTNRRTGSIHRCGRTQLPDLVIARLNRCTINIFEILHGAFAALERDLTDISSRRGLLIDGAVFERSERAFQLEPTEGRDQLVGIGCARFRNPCSKRLHGDVTDQRTKARMIIPALLVDIEEGLVGGGGDLVPWVAGHDPAHRGFVLERIEIFRLAREQAHYGAILEAAAGRAFTHEFRKISSEQHVEDGIRLGVIDRLYD